MKTIEEIFKETTRTVNGFAGVEILDGCGGDATDGLLYWLKLAVGEWLREHRHPLLPYPGLSESGQMEEEQWHDSQIARQTQLDELMAECGTDKFGKLDLSRLPILKPNLTKNQGDPK